jgi:hypothetical protein
MKTEHTKGPWEVEADSLRGNSYVAISGDEWIELATVVVRMKDGKESEEGLANARLIAAAPQLLAALEFIELSCRMGGMPDGWELPMLKVRAAIAKAKGGES